MKVFSPLYREASKMDALHYREMLDITMAGQSQFKVYKDMRARYNSMIYKGELHVPPTPPAMYLDSSSPDRKQIVMGIFRSAKRGMGYG